MQEISAGIIIYRRTKDGLKFLILYHGHGYWNFPKGKIESREKSFQTALREIREETGLTRSDLKFGDYFKTSEHFTFWRDKEKVSKNVTFYLAETKRKAIRISEVQEGQPHEGFAWFTYKEALDILHRHKDSQRILKQAYQFLQNKGIAPAEKIEKPQQQSQQLQKHHYKKSNYRKNPQQSPNRYKYSSRPSAEIE